MKYLKIIEVYKNAQYVNVYKKKKKNFFVKFNFEILKLTNIGR